MSDDSRLFRPTPAALAAMFVFLGAVPGLLAAPAITATKDDGVAAVTKMPAGSTITYGNTISNGSAPGTTTATGVQFIDPEVADTAYVADSLTATPVAIDDTYPATVIANSSINSATSGFSVITNDFAGFSGGVAVLNSALTISNVTTPAHGTVSMTLNGAGVGQFIYTPTPGYTGADSFNYEISNGVAGGTTVSRTGTVSLTVGGPVIWFVDPALGANGTGILGNPFNNLAAAVTAIGANTNHRIFIFSGGAAQTTGTTLNSGAWLVGQAAVGTTFEALMGGIIYPGDTTAARPSINHLTKPSLTRSAGTTLTLGENNLILGVAIGNTGGGFAISGSNINVGQIGNAITSDVDLSSGGSSSGAISLNGGSGNITCNAPITTTFGNSVSITNRTGGTVSFPKAISDASKGIALTNNGGGTGATINFTGGLLLSTGTFAAFTATGGGKVSATQNNTSIVNTISTTTGTALNVTNTTIDTPGLAFRSIAANGAANGIILNTTGALAGLTVTANGTLNSGGIIQNTTGDGIALTNTKNVSLDRMRIQDAGAQGISGLTVNGLTLKNTTIIGAGNADEENGIILGSSVGSDNGITGTVLIQDVVIDAPEQWGLRVRNAAAGTLNMTLQRLTVQNNTGTFGEDAVSIRIEGGTSTVLVDDCDFIDTGGKGVDGQCGGNSGASLHMTVQNSQFLRNLALPFATSFTTQGNASGRFLGSNNTATSSTTDITSSMAFDFDASDTSTLDATMTNNTANVTFGTGLEFVVNDNADGRIAASGNTINLDPGNVNVASQQGMNFHARSVLTASSTGQLDVTLGNNTITGITSAIFGFSGINFQSGSSTGTHAQTISLNVASSAGAGGNSVSGTAGSAFNLRQRTGTTFRVTGLVASGGVAGNVESFIQTNNSSGTLGGATVVANPSSSTIVNYTSGATVLPQTPALPLILASDGIEKAPMAPSETFASGGILTSAVESGSQPVCSLGTPAPETGIVSQAGLDSVVTAAIARWEATGLTSGQAARLRTMKFEIATLTHNHLGEAGGNTIRVDANAGGNGWFVDASAAGDALFGNVKSSTRRYTEPSAVPAGRVDLLTTVMHEMGHALGLADTYNSNDRESIMYGHLGKGERRLPASGQAEGMKSFEGPSAHFLSGALNPITIGTLPPGKSVVITYQVKINDPFTLGATQISSQGTVHSTTADFSDVLTDDPNSGTAGDPTITLLDRPDTTVVSIARAASTPSNAASLSWTLTLVDPIINLTSGNFSLVNSGLGGTPAITGVTAVGALPATQWTVSASTGTGDGTLGLDLVNDTGLSHDVTNLPFTGEVYTLDRTPPTVAMNSAVTSPTNTTPIPVTVQFSETVTGFAAGDIVPSNGTVGNFVAVDGDTYTFDLTPAGQGNVTADIAAGAAQDAATNASTAAVQFIRTFDSVQPTVAMTSATSNPTLAAPIPVTVQFSETVTGFTTGDIVPANGTVGGFAAVDGDTYTFDLTPSGPGVIVTADIAAAVAKDTAGNDNTAATQFSRTIVDAIAVATVNPGDNDADEISNTGTFTFTRGNTTGQLTADFQFDVSSTASASEFSLSGGGVTFVGSTGTVTFPDGVASVSVTLTPTAENPNVAEAAETVRLNVVGQNGIYVPGTPGNATVTIGANGFLVANTNDAGEGSLRQAILNSNAIAGAETITFVGGTFTDATLPDIIDLASALPAFTGQTSITGSGADKLLIRRPVAAGSFNLMQVQSASNVTLAGLTLSGGNGGIANLGGLTIDHCVLSGNSSSIYGGILNNGTLIVSNSTLSGNSSTSGAGGGIYNLGGSTLTLINSTLSGNSSLNVGGAISIVSGANITVSNSTISGNTAGSSGGGISNSGTLAVSNSTITGNSSTGSGGGIATFIGSSLTLANSIVAGNTATTESDINTFSGSNLISSNGANFIGDATGAAGLTVTDKTFASTGTILSQLLAPLASNGGPTQTHALPAASPALNVGSNASIPADTFDIDGDLNTAEAIPFDQRGSGFIRAIGTVDIGAFELQKSVAIVADAASAAEGSGSGNTAFTFTVIRTGDTTGDVTLDYAITGAANAADFGGTLPTGTVTIPDTQASVVLTINASKDGTVEPDEDFTVTLSNPTNGYILTTATAASTITNDDAATLTVAKVNDGAETNSPTSGLFRVTQSAASSTDTVVSYTVGGTATSGSDYTALSGSAIITAGNTTADITVPALGDALVESTETVSVTLVTITAGHPSITLGATLAASLDITDNDTATVTLAKIDDGAETASPTNGLFRVTQSALSSSDTTLTYTVGGTATSGSDFTALTGSVTIATGSNTADIVLPVLGDAIVEATETVSITLTGFTARDADVSLGVTAAASADITDDDTAIVSIANLNDGAETNTPTNGAFRISQSAVSSTDTVINIAISSSATPGEDFTAPVTGVLISAGSTFVDLIIPVLNDNFIEPTESVTATLSSLGSHNSGVSIASSPANSASLNITDNDIAASIAVSSGSGQSATVNTAFANPLVAIVRDSGGVALGGASVTFTANGVTANGTFSASATVMTDGAGLATAPAFTANTLSGSYTVTAATPGVVTPASFPLTNTPGAASKFFVTAPANAIAGEAFNVTVTAADSFDNTATAYAGTVHFTSTDSAAILPANSALVAGVGTFSVNLVTGGNQTVTATDTVTPAITGTSSAINVSPRADLAVTLSDSPDPVNAAGNLTYTVSLTNSGPSSAAAPLLILPLPASTTFVSATAPVGWVTNTPPVGGVGVVSFSGGAPASGETTVFTVIAKVDLNVINDTILTTTATAISPTLDPNPANNSATASTLAKSGADLQITLADSPDPVVAGTELTYTLEVGNNGPLDAENVSISDTLPPGTTFVSLSAPAGWSAVTPAMGSAGSIAITNPLFANADSATFTLVVKVGSDVADGSVLSNTAAVSSTIIDIAPGNNASTATSAVITRADLTIQITGTPSTAPKGSDVTYEITLANAGPSDASAPAVSLPIPSQMTFVSATAPGGWIAVTPAVGSGGTVNFSAGSLANGALVSFTVVARVNADAPTGTILTATATASATGIDPNPANNTASATVAVGTVNPTPIQLGTTGTLNNQSGLFELTVNVTNTTPLPINGFRLHVDFSAYLAAYPSLRLYNATSPVGSADVYVDYPYPVPLDGMVPVKLSFYTSTRTFPSPFAPVLTVETLASSQVPDTNGGGVQPRIVMLPDGTVLLEFPSVVGHWYRVRYSSDLQNWSDCPVPLQAGTNRMQWIDSGPPFTNVPPSDVPSRYYRVNEIAAP